LMLDEQWKISWKPNVDIWELYDLRSDPSELKNLADDHADVLRAGASKLLHTVRNCGHTLTK
jgi:arylsulfatase A-like enzyme